MMHAYNLVYKDSCKNFINARLDLGPFISSLLLLVFSKHAQVHSNILFKISLFFNENMFFSQLHGDTIVGEKNADFLADDTQGAKMSKRCGGVPAVCYQGLFVLESGTGLLLSKINFVAQTEPFQSV